MKSLPNDMLLSPGCYWYAHNRPGIAAIGNVNDRNQRRPDHVHAQE